MKKPSKHLVVCMQYFFHCQVPRFCLVWNVMKKTEISLGHLEIVIYHLVQFRCSFYPVDSSINLFVFLDFGMRSSSVIFLHQQRVTNTIDKHYQCNQRSKSYLVKCFRPLFIPFYHHINRDIIGASCVTQNSSYLQTDMIKTSEQ